MRAILFQPLYYLTLLQLELSRSRSIYQGSWCPWSLCCKAIDINNIDYAGYRDSIMGTCAGRSSPVWVCIPEMTSDSDWFLWNTNSQRWTPFCMDAHDWFYFLTPQQCIFSVIISQKHRKSLSNRRKSQMVEIRAECGRKMDPCLPWWRISMTLGLAISTLRDDFKEGLNGPLPDCRGQVKLPVGQVDWDKVFF